jgi:hypothetical protein
MKSNEKNNEKNNEELWKNNEKNDEKIYPLKVMNFHYSNKNNDK